MSTLKKCVTDCTQIIPWVDLPIELDVSYDEGHVCILPHETKQLRKRSVPLLIALWHHRGVEEASWKLESNMKEKYPHFFIKP